MPRCGKQITVSWSPSPVQPCPLIAPLPPNGWVPVYSQPVQNPSDATPPAPAAWLNGIDNQYFVCDREYRKAARYLPSGWRNDWWAYTRASDGRTWGWVPEVFLKGSDDDSPTPSPRMASCGRST